MKTALRKRIRRLSYILLPCSVLLLLFISPALQAPAAEDSFYSGSVAQLRKELADCESNETKFRVAMAELKRLWEKKAALAKEHQRTRRIFMRAKEGRDETLDIANKAWNEYQNLRKRCESAYKSSGRPMSEYDTRWYEVKECVEEQWFVTRVYDKKLSAYLLKENEYWESRSKDLKAYELSYNASKEYLGALNQYGLGTGSTMDEFMSADERSTPEAKLREISGRCRNLRVKCGIEGYDPAVRVAAAIKDCRFGDADRFAADMPTGPARAALERNLAEARARAQQVYRIFQEGKELYNRGKAEESSGGFDRARSLYQEALARFGQARDLERCESRLPTIYNALSVVGKRISGLKAHETQQPREKTKIFHNPTIGGLPIDACYQWAKDCQKPAADEFCRRNGFSGAASWKTDEPMPRTRIISSGQICETGKNWRSCGGFTFIECK